MTGLDRFGFLEQRQVLAVGNAPAPITPITLITSLARSASLRRCELTVWEVPVIQERRPRSQASHFYPDWSPIPAAQPQTEERRIPRRKKRPAIVTLTTRRSDGTYTSTFYELCSCDR